MPWSDPPDFWPFQESLGYVQKWKVINLLTETETKKSKILRQKMMKNENDNLQNETISCNYTVAMVIVHDIVQRLDIDAF